MAEQEKITLEEIEQELVRRPQDIKLRILYAEALIDEGFLEDALDEYESLTNVFPDDPEIIFNLGVIYEKKGDWDKALNFYEKASDIMPEDPDFRYNVAFMLDKKGEIARAIDEYTKTIELNPEDANAYFNLGYLYVNQGETELAIEHFKMAKELNPEDIYARFDLAFEYKKIGESEKALEEYFELIEVCSAYSWAYFNIACIFYEMGDVEKAIEYFIQTTNANPKDIETYKILSDIALTPQDALEYLNDGLEKNSDNGELHYYISKVYKKMGNDKKQLFHLEKSVQNKETLFINPLLVSEEIRKLSKKLNKNV